MVEIYANTTDSSLIGRLMHLEEVLDIQIADIDEIKEELIQRGAAQAATTIYGKTMKFVISVERKTDWSKMPPVLEFFRPEEKTEAFTPEHTITVPETIIPETIIPEHDDLIPAKWATKGTIMKIARRHGDDAVLAVDDATFPAKTTGKLEPLPEA